MSPGLTIHNTLKGFGVFAARGYAAGEPVYSIRPGNDGMLIFTNHSCDPNCKMQLMLIVATKPIALGDELTLDYEKIQLDIKLESFKCQCGAANCRGYIHKERRIVENSGGNTQVHCN